MLEHELVLLGLLKESPKHGYEIKLKIREILSLFAGLDVKSIYYPLSILEKEGLVARRRQKQGKRPQRQVYTLTPKGRARFEELLTKSFLDFKRPRFSLDLSLYFLEYIRPEVARRRLQARMQILKRLSASLNETVVTFAKKKSRASCSVVRILEHNASMVDTELRFLASLVKTL
jgi:DNA-binding PadR family transcriptional regulator